MGGGKGSTTTTVDPKYNEGMLKLSQEQQQWAEEMFNQFKHGVPYDPNASIKGAYVNGKFVEEKNLPEDFGGALETKNAGEVFGYDPNKVSEMDYMQNQIEAGNSILGLQTDVSKLQLESEKDLIPQQTALLQKRMGLASSYLDDVSKGINKDERMDQAQASVQHGFKLADEKNRMNISSFGLDPSSGRYASQNREMGIAEAAGVAGARTTARTQAEEEELVRKASGLKLTA